MAQPSAPFPRLAPASLPGAGPLTEDALDHEENTGPPAPWRAWRSAVILGLPLWVLAIAAWRRIGGHQ